MVDYTPLIPLYLALVGNCILWGVACMQGFQYSLYHSKNDSSLVKLLVAFLLSLNTGHVVLVIVALWKQVTHWPSDKVDINLPLLWGDLLTAIVALTSQLFFTYRLWKFSPKNWLSWSILAIFVTSSVYQLGAYIAFTTLCAIKKLTVAFFEYEKLVLSIWGMAAAQDILITVVLIVLIYQHRHGALPSSVQIMHRLTIYVVNTGLWTALCALFVIITMVSFPSTLVWLALYMMICPLYTNTVLANLNGRTYIRGSSNVVSSSTGYSRTPHAELHPTQATGMVFALGTVHSSVDSTSTQQMSRSDPEKIGFQAV